MTLNLILNSTWDTLCLRYFKKTDGIFRKIFVGTYFYRCRVVCPDTSSSVNSWSRASNSLKNKLKIRKKTNETIKTYIWAHNDNFYSIQCFNLGEEAEATEKTVSSKEYSCTQKNGKQPTDLLQLVPPPSPPSTTKVIKEGFYCNISYWFRFVKTVF